MPQVFEGLRVIDFSSGMAGSIATMVMADNGAEVVKVEPPTGDPFRSLPAWRQWHRGTKGVVLDLQTEVGVEQAQRLAASGDVIVQSFRPGVPDGLGIGYETLSASNPGLIYCSITGFGQKGPYANYKDYDALVQAKGGRMMDYQSAAEREGPTFTAVPVATFAASQFALQGIVAALYVRGRTGLGQRVDTSVLQGLGFYDMYNWLSVQLHDRFPETYPALSTTVSASMGGSYFYLVAPTQDGHWLQFANLASHLFRAFVQAVDLEEVFNAAGTMEGTLVPLGGATEELWEVLLLKIQEKSLAEWMDIFMPNLNIAVEPLLHTQQGMEHPQMLHNGHVIEVEDPQAGKTRQLGPLVTFSETPSKIQGPAPTLGQHTQELLSQPDRSVQAPMPVVGADALPRHALEGVTVLELSSYLAAPLSTSLLADLGARVIKIENLEGDPLRTIQGCQRTVQGKESLALDLKASEGREVLYKLVERADLLMHNFRPGVPERLGMDYGTLCKLNPGLVYVYSGSYGSSGPYSLRPAYHPIPGAICGGALNQVGQGTPPPPGTSLSLDDVKRYSRRLARANEGNPDPNSGLVTCTALLMGLYTRERTGKGQYIETTMLCANAYVNSDDFIRYEGKPDRRLPDAELHGLSSLYRLYPCREGWIFLACLLDEEWEALRLALGSEELQRDKRFASHQSRLEHDAELGALLSRAFEERDAPDWEKYLAEYDVPCVVADAGRYYAFFNEDLHIEANGMATEVEHPVYGKYKRHSSNVSLSLTPGVVGPGNRAGEHSRLILEELGYSPSEIRQQKAKGVVTWPE